MLLGGDGYDGTSSSGLDWRGNVSAGRMYAKVLGQE